jgi:hypothetical protein
VKTAVKLWIPHYGGENLNQLKDYQLLRKYFAARVSYTFVSFCRLRAVSGNIPEK